MEYLIYVYIVLLLLLDAFWLALVFFYLPGNWLMVLSTAGFAWWQWDRGLFSPWTLAAIAVLALVGEIVEFFAGFGGAKKAGASFWGSAAAIGGAFAGAFAGTFLIPIPFMGTLFGGCFGAGLVTWWFEHYISKRTETSLRSGVGAGAGVFVGIVFKVLMGMLIWLTVAVAVFWP